MIASVHLSYMRGSDGLQCTVGRMGAYSVLNDALYEDVLAFCMRVFHVGVCKMASRWNGVEWAVGGRRTDSEGSRRRPGQVNREDVRMS